MDYIKRMRAMIGHERMQAVGASVVVHRDGKVLLQKRRDNGCWTTHGGCVEMGETTEQAARRELREETGLTAGALELIGVFSGQEMFYTYPNGDQVSIVDVGFLCEDFSGQGLDQTDETTELRWFDFKDLPANISPPCRPALERGREMLRARRAETCEFEIRAIEGDLRAQTDDLIAAGWGGYSLVSRGVLHDCRDYPGLVAIAGGKVIGYLLHNIVGDECEILVLESLCENCGVGGALITAVTEMARAAGCRRIWLVTSNDNTHAIRFYQRRGMALCAVHLHAMDEARRLKPQIPATGNDGLPIDHEIEFEVVL